MKYKYLLFDLDNTLLSFDKSEAFALRQTFEDSGIPFLDEYEPIYHKINRTCWERFERNELTIAELKTLRMQLTLEQLCFDRDPILFSEQYRDHLSSTAFFVDGAWELIQHLHGQYELIIITNGITKVQESRLKNTNLNPYFSHIVISEKIGTAKPNTAFFDYTFDQIGHPPKEEVLVIGDSLGSDILGGNNYGVDTCWHNFKLLENTKNIQPTYEIHQILDLKNILNT